MFLTDKLEEIQQLLWRRKEHMVSTKMVIYQDMINSYCLVGYNSIHVKPYGKHTGINAQLIIAVVDQTWSNNDASMKTFYIQVSDQQCVDSPFVCINCSAPVSVMLLQSHWFLLINKIVSTNTEDSFYISTDANICNFCNYFYSLIYTEYTNSWLQIFVNFAATIAMYSCF